MVPEFPMPPSEADLYHSKLYEKPPLFGVYSFKMPEFTTGKLEARIINPLNLLRPVKTAEVRNRMASTRKTSTLRSSSRLDTVSHQLSIMVSSRLSLA